VCCTSVPPARPERQASDVLGLHEITWHTIGDRRRAEQKVANGNAADLHSRCGVALDQRRRDAQRIRDVVEALARIISGQERGLVDVEGQQIPNGVRVLGTIQSVEAAASRVGMRRCRSIEASFETAGERIERRAIGPRHATRRHEPRPHLANDLLPRVSVITG
jgi:hypothetical protein